MSETAEQAELRNGSEASRRLAIVILSYQGREDTLACLASLCPQLGPNDMVVVVDNGSTDGTEQAVRQQYPTCRFLQNGSNLGFAGGNNVGLQFALDADYAWILMLNNDTITPAGTVARMLEHASAAPANIGVFQPLLVRADDPAIIDSAGHGLRRLPGVYDLGLGDLAATASGCAVFGACGAAALFRAATLRAAGLLDEELFVLCEDADLMFRVQASGLQVELIPQVQIQHRRGVSRGDGKASARRRRKFWLQRNIVVLALRYWPWRYLLLAAPVLSYRALQALWLKPAGSRCASLWRQGLAQRRAARAGLRAHGVDRWFGVGFSTGLGRFET